MADAATATHIVERILTIIKPWMSNPAVQSFAAKMQEAAPDAALEHLEHLMGALLVENAHLHQLAARAAIRDLAFLDNVRVTPPPACSDCSFRMERQPGDRILYCGHPRTPPTLLGWRSMDLPRPPECPLDPRCRACDKSLIHACTPTGLVHADQPNVQNGRPSEPSPAP